MSAKLSVGMRVRALRDGHGYQLGKVALIRREIVEVRFDDGAIQFYAEACVRLANFPLVVPAPN